MWSARSLKALLLVGAAVLAVAARAQGDETGLALGVAGVVVGESREAMGEGDKGGKVKGKREKPEKKDEVDASPYLGAWASVGTAEYSSCPGIEAGHQDSFTLAVSEHKTRGLVATETPEQGMARQLAVSFVRREGAWVLLLRDKGGDNGMDLKLSAGGKRLEGTRVTVRQGTMKKARCAVVWAVVAQRS